MTSWKPPWGYTILFRRWSDGMKVFRRSRTYEGAKRMVEIAFAREGCPYDDAWIFERTSP